MKRLLYIVIALAVLPVVAWTGVSCQREGYVDESKVELEFSADTLTFDTVFTSYSTPTRLVKIYNRTTHNVLLSSITLAEGRSSRFRLNVDGDTSMVARNVEIMAGDSIFIYVQAHINPNEQTEPFIIADAIRISNGQRIVLTAWGRNAVYHRHKPGSWVHVIDCEGWDHSRPHVFIDTVAVDSATTLHLVAGDEVYFAPGALLLVYTGGTLDVRGSADRPVLFTSLRHDGWYDYLPGQWAGIWLYAGSVDNFVDHALVENATYAFLVDTNVGPRPTLQISNTIIRNIAFAGLFAQGARIEANNLLLYQCGTATLYARCGGDYAFDHCTFANYWSYGSQGVDGGRQFPGVILQNWYLSATGDTIRRDMRRANFSDCIIYGTFSSGEVLLDPVNGALFNTAFEHSLVKGGEWDEDPMFVDPSENDYHLQDESPAIGIGYQFDD